jgi:tRNA pseudouridine38-40 synthase
MADYGDRLHLRFVGDGFLHNMIRLLVGSMVEIALGRSEWDMSDLLKDRSRLHTRFLAPAGGLFLVAVHY